MSKINTGGPAFPYAFPDKPGDDFNVAFGMTLRDYFAAKAMQGLLSGTTTNDGLAIVKDAYKMADSMLKARGA